MRVFLILILSLSMFTCDNESENVQQNNSGKTLDTTPSPKETTISKGYTLFEHHCAVCHTVKGANGPSLEGITTRVPQPYKEWLHKYIKNNVAVMKSGDVYAKKIFAASGNMSMPAFDSVFDDEHIDYIIDFLANPNQEMKARNPDV